MTDNLKHYSRMAIALHWGMALIIIPMLLLGEQTMGSHDARFLPTLHASAGFLLLAAVAFRLFWRLKHKPPAVHSSIPDWQRRASRLSHFGLYAAMILIPLTGWLAYTEHVRRSLGMSPASLFWLAKIPLLPDFGINFHLIHNWGGKAFFALITLHIAAALKHHFYDKNDTLKRMLKW